jgi:hypothetical protein
MQDRDLVKVTVVTDDDTGMYGVGDLDFGIPMTTIDWLDAKPERAKKLADWMRWLADQCEKRERPFNSLKEPNP